jgi:DNA replication protein DnaC
MAIPTALRAAATVGSSSPDEVVVPVEGSPPATLCPLCGGAGWLRRDVPIGHVLFGQPVLCRCKATELQQQRLERMFATSRLGDHLRGMTFDTFSTQDIPYDPSDLQGRWTVEEVRLSLGRALRAARSFVAELQGWLVLVGDFGCGKTHLAVAIANERIAHGEPALFQVVPDLLDHLRATFAPSSSVTYDDLFEEVRTAPLLILDDLGAQSNSPWAEEKLFQIINYRYNYRLPTVITTNVELDRHHPRLASRMSDMGPLVQIKAPDFRGGLAPHRTVGGKMPASLRGRMAGR